MHSQNRTKKTTQMYMQNICRTKYIESFLPFLSRQTIQHAQWTKVRMKERLSPYSTTKITRHTQHSPSLFHTNTLGITNRKEQKRKKKSIYVVYVHGYGKGCISSRNRWSAVIRQVFQTNFPPSLLHRFSIKNSRSFCHQTATWFCRWNLWKQWLISVSNILIFIHYIHQQQSYS